MFKHRLITLATLTALAASGSALASTAELKVEGTVVPSACTITLGSSGTVSFGTIRSHTLNTATATSIGNKDVTLAVSCLSPVKFALRATDDRATSRAAGVAATALSGATDAQAYGLGMAGQANIGAYVLTLKEGKLGTANATFSRSTDSSTWATNATLHPSLAATPSLTGWINGAATAPADAAAATATLTVSAAIAAASTLDLTSDVSLDGQATIELVYL